MKLSKTKQFPALFATNTVDGPRDAAHLVTLLHACGMSAAAWMVQGMAEQVEDAEERIYTEAEADDIREDLARDAAEELEPYQKFFDSIVEALEEKGDGWGPRARPDDSALIAAIAADIEQAANARAKEEAAKEAREVIRKASAERRAAKTAK